MKSFLPLATIRGLVLLVPIGLLSSGDAQLQRASPLPVVSNGDGFVYQPSKGRFWDPSVIYENGNYYMFSMYGGESIFLATSQDGVHWRDYGVVLHSEGFKNNRVWKPYIAKVGDRYILNHGAFTDLGTNNNLLRFYESKDLIHWTYLYEVPIDTHYYLANGRWDHMYMIPRDDGNPKAGYLGYQVADPIGHGGFGMMESPDGIHYHPIKAPDIEANFEIPTLEVGGIKKFGHRYYLLGGNVNHYGFHGYGVYTYVADSPMGPFRPDMGAYRLTGTSGIDGDYYVHILAAFVKDSPEDLVSDPFSFSTSKGTNGQGVWFLPMRKAIVDGQGHLHLAYWKQNDLAKGDEIKVDAKQNTVAFPPGQTASDPIIKVEASQDSVVIQPDKLWKPFSWLDATKTRKGVVLLNQTFDLDNGVIIEGNVQARVLNSRTQDSHRTFAGFFIEGADRGPGTAILLEVGEMQWRESLIGTLRLDTDFHFDTLDATGRNAATVTGLDNDKVHSFRLWIRGGQMELYIDDLLMQTFFFQKSSGKIGFISQESEAQFTDLKFYQMNFSTWKQADQK